MSKKTPAYQEQREMDCNRQLQQLETELPVIAGDFLRAIAGKQPLTRLGYAKDLRVFFRFLPRELAKFADIDPAAFTAEDLRRVTLRDLEIYQSYLMQYVQENGQGETKLIRNHERGLARKLSSLRSFFRYLYMHDLLSENITEKLMMPKIHQQPIIYLERDEIARMVDAVLQRDGMTDRQKVYLRHTEARDLAILYLFLGSGIRVSELAGLDVQDIDLQRMQFAVTRKGGNRAILGFNEQVRDALADWLAVREEIQPLPGHEQALFLSLQRKRLGVRALEKTVKKYAEVAAPLKAHLSPHKLRKTYGTSLYHASGDINLVADMLGHASVNTTKRYYVDSEKTNRDRARKYVDDWMPER